MSRSTAGWRFGVTDLAVDRRVVQVGESIVLSCLVVNEGKKLGTAYVRFLIADSYRTDDSLVFDSDRDWGENEKRTLRLVDLPVGERRKAACRWKIPAESLLKHFDIKVELWNPHRLFGGRWPFLFHETGWTGGFEVIAPPKATSLRAFISYAWDSPAHQRWVREFAEELLKHGVETVFDQKDLFPGEDAMHFMERGISETAVTLVVCTENYTNKADARHPGGVGYETILSAHEYSRRTPKERARFIPIIRDNGLPPGLKLPKYLGGSFYLDMSGHDWRAEPMTKLVQAIERFG